MKIHYQDEREFEDEDGFSWIKPYCNKTITISPMDATRDPRLVTCSNCKDKLK